MPPNLDEQWLSFAKNDLMTAEVLHREGIWNQVCFHSQQAIEKLLKSAIPCEKRPRSHKLSELLSLIPPGPFVLSEDNKKRLRRLDRFYIPTRYPDALPGALEEGMPSKSDADEAIQTAKVIFEFFGR